MSFSCFLLISVSFGHVHDAGSLNFSPQCSLSHCVFLLSLSFFCCFMFCIFVGILSSASGVPSCLFLFMRVWCNKVTACVSVYHGKCCKQNPSSPRGQQRTSRELILGQQDFGGHFENTFVRVTIAFLIATQLNSREPLMGN